MLGKTSVSLALLLIGAAVFIEARSDPMQRNAEDRPPSLKRDRRTFGFNWFGSRDWPQFRQIWRLPTFPTITGMSFFDDERYHENFHKRITDLEDGHRRIVNYIRKLNSDKTANGCGASTQLPSMPEAASSTAAEPQTPSSTTPVTADDSAVKFPQEQQTILPTVGTRLKDEKAEAATTTSDEHADKETVVTTTIPEESPNNAETTTVAPDNEDSEETNDVFV